MNPYERHSKIDFITEQQERSAIASETANRAFSAVEVMLKPSIAVRNALEEMARRAREHDELFAAAYREEGLIGIATAQLRQSQYELSLASELARMKAVATERASEFERFIVPKFDFPAFPKLAEFHSPIVEFQPVAKSHGKGAIRMADEGWTIAAWMPMSAIPELESASAGAIDSFFVAAYLGTDGQVGELKGVRDSLLKSSKMGQWSGLLAEIFDCLGTGKHRICVPSLLTVLEGFTAESLAQQSITSRHKTEINKSVKKANWHQDNDFSGLLWTSVVTFLDHLFAASDFESKSPSFINRHWILHGRTETDWTEVDALKLVNALATLHWLFE